MNAPLRQHALDPIDDWLGHARAGDEHVYFTGESADGVPAARRARALYEQGRVELYRRRAAGGLRGFDYCMRLRREVRPPFPASAAAFVRQPSRSVDEEADRLLGVLLGLARRGKPCPSNRQLARLAQIDGGADAIRYRLDRLSCAHAIAIRREGDGRIVRIIAAQAETGVPA